MFIRTIAYLLLTVFLITFLRYVIGMIGRAFTDLLRPGSRPSPGPRAGGELKKDPVCGTFVAAETSVKKTVAGEVVHFCSEACRDKFPAS